MSRFGIFTRLLALSLGATALWGCQASEPKVVDDGPPKASLKIGIVDTTRVLPEMPAYRDLKTNMMRDRNSFVASLPQDPSRLTKEQMTQYQAEAQQKQANWRKKTLETIQEATKTIKSQTAEVAQQKKIDLVVVSTPFANSLFYYSGEDITLDVMLKMNK